MTDYRHILVAVDFSAATEQLCTRASDLAQRYAARLSLVHVVEPVVIGPAYDMLPELPFDVEEELRTRAEAKLAELAGRYAIEPADAQVLNGLTKGAILEHAEANGVDLIVVGSHGRHGVGLLLGSTANAVLHGARCDVLAVRIRE
jgi:universal stress protein A